MRLSESAAIVGRVAHVAESADAPDSGFEKPPLFHLALPRFTFIDTWLRLNREETLRFKQEADAVQNTNERTTMLELTTSWKEKGVQEGRQEESPRLVQRQLPRRCGALPAEVEARLRKLSLEQLESLAEALLDFRSLTDLTDWLLVQ